MDAAPLARLADALPPLTPAALRLLGDRAPNPLTTYAAILADAHRLDVSGLDATDLRRRFNGFYGVRRNAAWRARFYEVFEAAKGGGEDPVEIFERALAQMAASTGRVEASFVSKLVATLRPSAPVIDSIVRAFLNRHVEAPPFGGAGAAVIYYRWLCEVMTSLSETSQARAWSPAFEAAFPAEVAGVPHPVKRLDFLIWAGSRV